jgi:D-alanyl-lipoteichoic acid acyltransferase DltB (MBOAT superfamily)
MTTMLSSPGVIQYLQFGYQKGVLYRLKALGERHDMDITIEGFHTWMWKGLSFLLPFLFGGYIFQAYNSFVLYKLSRHPDAPWQVFVLSILFFVLFIGNTLTTVVVIPQKLRGKIKESYRLKSVSWAMKIRQQIKVSPQSWLRVFWLSNNSSSFLSLPVLLLTG